MNPSMILRQKESTSLSRLFMKGSILSKLTTPQREDSQEINSYSTGILHPISRSRKWVKKEKYHHYLRQLQKSEPYAMLKYLNQANIWGLQGLNSIQLLRRAMMSLLRSMGTIVAEYTFLQ